MNQQQPSENNPPPIPEPSIQQQVENSALGSGMQALTVISYQLSVTS
jgi:hypothetical protein